MQPLRTARVAVALVGCSRLGTADSRGVHSRAGGSCRTPGVEAELRKYPCGRGCGVQLPTHHPRDQPKRGPSCSPWHQAVQLLQPPAVAEPRRSRDGDLLKDWTHAVSYGDFPGQFLGAARASPCPFWDGGRCQWLLLWRSSMGST